MGNWMDDPLKHYQDPYLVTSIMESQFVFFSWLIWLVVVFVSSMFGGGLHDVDIC